MNPIRIALAGNPNCGKTTLFNALTGSNQFVGNWPGVTVEKKEGRLKKHPEVILTDLPGIYSLSPYTLEEVVARKYLLDERPDAILNIVDGTNLERNLYLTTQLLELEIPVVIAVNMMDVVRKTGDVLNTEALSRQLGCPVVEISALKGLGITEAAEAAIQATSAGKTPPVRRFSDPVEQAVAQIEAAFLTSFPRQKRWYAIKLLEGDSRVLEQLAPAQADLTEIRQAVEEELEDDAESLITGERYGYISSIIDSCYRRKAGRTLSASDKIDRVVTNRFLALPIFAVVMFLVYFIAVSTVGTAATDWANDGVFGDGWHLFGVGTSAYEEALDGFAEENLFTEDYLGLLSEADAAGVIGSAELLEAAEARDFAAFAENLDFYGEGLEENGYPVLSAFEENTEALPEPSAYGIWVPGIPVLVERGLEKAGTPDWLNGLILDGIVGGVGAVLGFVPQMMVLFLLLAFLEACGYMARIAFVLDRVFRKFGLSGKSFIPMLIGSGCGVPGIMASRTIENERDRRMTVMTTTFIPCGAKLPMIALIATALFDGAWWVAPSAYLLGITAVIVSGILLKKTVLFSGEPAPFVMELPAYHWPTPGNLLRSMWERAWSFIKKAGTIILLSSMVIWAGSVFGIVNGSLTFDPEMALESSFLGLLGGAVCWIFSPLGFGNIQAAVATLMGLVAKEEVVGVFGVLDFAGMTPLAGYAFLTFNLLCAPCFAAIGAIRREMNSAKWTWLAIFYQCGFAYAAALMIFQFGSLFTGSVQILGLAAAVVVFVLMLYFLFRPNRASTRINRKAGVR